MYHRTWGQMSNSRFLKGSSPPGAEPGTWLLAPPSVGFTLSRLSHFCWREAMIHQFIHFFVIWILSFQHLSSPVTCSFGQLWGCCLFLGYSLWYVVDQWHCVCLLPIYSTINSWILFLDYQWHMSGEFLGQFCASYRYKYACQGHLKLYAFKYKYTFQGYMHLYAHNCIWRHGSTALRDWLKKKRNIVFF